MNESIGPRADQHRRPPGEPAAQDEAPLSIWEIRDLMEKRLSPTPHLMVGVVEELDNETAVAPIMDLTSATVLTVHVDRRTGEVRRWK